MSYDKKLASICSRFSRCEYFTNKSGNIALTFAIALLPLMIAAGTAVDYSRLSNEKSKLQDAIDAAVLASAVEVGITDTARIRLAQDFFTSNAQNPCKNDASFLIKVKRIRGNASCKVPTTFMNLIGLAQMTLVATAAADWDSQQELEIALVLDSTGSMARTNRMSELKQAVSIFADQLEPNASSVRMAIVPFDTQVKLENVSVRSSVFDDATSPFSPGVNCKSLTKEDKKDCEKFQKDCVGAKAKRHKRICRRAPVVSKDNKTITSNNDLLGISETSWSGCMIDREQPYDVSYDAADPLITDSQYPQAHCATSALQPILPLTNNFGKIRSHVAKLQPSGNTNITIGLQWGMETLTKPLPFNETRSSGSKPIRKIMVLVTDGNNTQNRWTTSQREINERTLKACTSAKNMVAELFTIRLINGNANLIRSCASSKNHYYNVHTASQVSAIFQDIATRIKTIRLVN